MAATFPPEYAERAPRPRVTARLPGRLHDHRPVLARRTGQLAPGRTDVVDVAGELAAHPAGGDAVGRRAQLDQEGLHGLRATGGEVDLARRGAGTRTRAGQGDAPRRR